MSEIVANKKIVFSAVDNVTQSVAAMNTKIDELMQRAHSLQNAFQSAASSSGSFKSSLEQMTATADRAKSAVGGLDEKIKSAHDKTIKVDANTGEANRKVDETKAKTESLPKTHTTIIKMVSSGFGSVKNDFGKINGGFEQINKGAAGAKKALGYLAVGAAAAATGIGAAVVSGAKQATALQNSYKVTENLIRTGGESASTAIKRVSEMQRDGKQYAMDYGKSQGDIADAYQDLVKRGHTSAEAIAVMKTELQASVASGDDFKDVVTMSSNAIESFGLKTNNTNQMMKNTREVVNDMAYSSDTTATNFQDMGIAMSYAGSASHQAGQTVRDTAAAIGVLSNRGIEGSMAGTSLRQIMTRLIKPTKAGAEALDELGIKLTDFQTKSGKMKPIGDIFQTLHDKMKGMSDVKISETMKDLFGQTAFNAGGILMENARQITDLVQKEKDAVSHDYVADLAKRNAKTVKVQMERAKQAINAFSITIGTAFLPAFSELSTQLAKGLQTKGAQRELKDFSRTLANTGRDIGKYLIVHGPDLAKMAKSIGSITVSIGKGAWSVFSSVIKDIAGAFNKMTGHKGKKGDALSELADSLQSVAKHKKAIEDVGKAIATYFIASKIAGFAKGVSDIAGGLFKIASVPIEKLIGVMSAMNGTYKGNSQVMQAISRHNTPTYPIAKSAASDTEATQTGMGLGAKLSAGLTIGMAGFDIFKGITAKNNNTRAKDIGSGIGTLIGGGIGAAVGGPVGALVGSQLGQVLGDKMGPTFTKEFESIMKNLPKLGEKLFGKDKVTAKKGTKDYDDQRAKKYRDKAREMQSQYSIGPTPKDVQRTIDYYNKEADAAEKAAKRARAASKSTHTHKKTSTAKAIREVATTHVSKTDIANVKTMTSAIKKYDDAISGLKSTIKKNDPTKELNGMNKRLNTAAKAWSKLSKPIASLKKSFSSLGSINKNLKNFNKDIADSKAMDRFKKSLLSLEKTLKGLKIKTYMADLNKAIKKSDPSKELSKIDKSLDKSVKSWSKLAKAVNRLKKAFSGFKTIDKNLSTFNKTIGNSKPVKTFERDLNSLDKALRKSKIGQYFANLKKSIIKNDPSKEFDRISKDMEKDTKGWRKLDRPINKLVKSMSGLYRSLEKMTRQSPFDKLNKSLSAFDKTVSRSHFGTELAKEFSIANKAMGNTGFVKEFNSMVRSIDSSLKSFVSSFKRYWRSLWNSTYNTLDTANGKIDRAFSTHSSTMLHEEESFESSFNKSWRGWLNYITDRFNSAFEKLGGYAEKGMSKIITEVNKGIGAVNTVIKAFGGSELKTAHYAGGTSGAGLSVHPGGPMMINDSGREHYKEIVKLASGEMFTSDKRDVLLPYVPSGAQVLNGEQSAPYLKYDSGTSSADAILEHSDDVQKNPLKYLEQSFFSKASFTGTEFVEKFGHALGEGLLKAISKPFAKMAETESAPAGAGVQRWADQVKRALSMNGLSTDESMVQRVLRQIQTESGGNEKAIQGNIGDINNKTGDLAEGLMQVIGATFNAYKFPGHNDRLNGFDSLLAGIAYAKAKYGPSLSFLGNGHGYAGGGHITTDQFARIGDNAEHDEYVVNPYAGNARSLVNEIESKMPRQNAQSGSGLSGLLNTVVNKLTEIAEKDYAPMLNLDETRTALNKSNARELRVQ